MTALLIAVNKGSLVYEVTRTAPDGPKSLLLSVGGKTERGWVSAVTAAAPALVRCDLFRRARRDLSVCSTLEQS